MPVTVSGSGRSYAIVNNSFTNAASGTVISPADANATHTDIAAALNTALGFSPIEGQRRMIGIQAYTATPPSSPSDGLVWLVAPGGTGVFAGKDKKYAAYISASWMFFDPVPGDMAVVVSTLQFYLFDGSSAWVTGIVPTTAGLNTAIPVFTGDSGSGGAKGQVPGPAAGDATKFLRGSGGWADPPGRSVGDLIPTASVSLPALCVWPNGQNLSRNSYSALFDAITVRLTVTITAGTTATVAAYAQGTTAAEAIAAGMPIEGAGIPAGTTVSAFNAGTGAITLSATSTNAAGVAARVFPYGNGNGSTTFGVPDLRGTLPLGRDNMGGTAAGRVTAVVSTVAATRLGGVGGSQAMHAHSHDLAPYGPTGSFSQTGTSVAIAGPGGSFPTSIVGTGAAQNMPPVTVLNYALYAGV